MHQRVLGSGLEVSAIGYGAMVLVGLYGDTESGRISEIASPGAGGRNGVALAVEYVYEPRCATCETFVGGEQSRLQ